MHRQEHQLVIRHVLQFLAQPSQLTLAEFGDVAAAAPHVAGFTLTRTLVLDVVQNHEVGAADVERVVGRPEEALERLERVPVVGRMTFVVMLPHGVVAPKTIVGHHTQANTLPGHAAPRTLFTLQAEPTVVKGAYIARYEGFARTDAGTGVTLDFPRRVANKRVNGRDTGFANLTKRKFIFAVSGGAEYRFDARPEDNR